MQIETYLKNNYPDILQEYKQYERRTEPPKVGATVQLRYSGHGYNYPSGSKVKVVDIVKKGQPSEDGAIWGGDYIVLSSNSVIEIENWWKEISIVKE